jgi:dihydroorotase
VRFDLLIRGGRVIDPAAGLDAIADVAITRGYVAAVDAAIPPDSAFTTVDAGGLIVTPGLIDFHTHVFHRFTYWGLDPDAIGPRSGVTTWVDAGSAGAITLTAFREHVVAPAEVRIRAFLNIAYTGLVGPDFELHVLELCDVDLFERMCHLHRDLVVGCKVRMGTPTVGANGTRPLAAAREAADRCAVPMMVHIADAPPGIDDVLAFMRAGDIVTHCCSGATMKLVDDRGGLLESTRRALDRGVVLDLGHGAGGMTFDSAEALLAAGVSIDVLSTDLHQMSIHGAAVAGNDASASPFITVRDDGTEPFDLPTCISKFLALGVELPAAIAAVTARPAQLLGEDGRIGCLAPGAHGDVALFEVEDGAFDFYDTAGAVRRGSRRLRNVATFISGREAARRSGAPPAPWVDLIAGKEPARGRTRA